MESSPKTISQGIRFFKERYIFSEKNTTTQRMYFRAIHLFGIFLLLEDDGITDKVSVQFKNRQKVKADLDEYIERRYFKHALEALSPPEPTSYPSKLILQRLCWSIYILQFWRNF
jgi:hypothetical protein